MLFRNTRFMVNEMSQQNASEFALCTSTVFPIRKTLVYVCQNKPGYPRGENKLVALNCFNIPKVW